MTFVKGKSGNPKGRPIGTLSLVDILRQKLGKVKAGTSNTYAEALVDSYIAEAMEKTELKKDAFDRMDGRPKAAIDDLGSKDNPINLTVTVKRL